MDHYKTLGLGRGATKEEIKAAFRRCALEFHPDRHSHSTKDVRNRALLRFKQATEAYEVLIDEGKRVDYDRLPRSRPSTGRASESYSGHRGYNYRYGGGGGYGGWQPPRSGSQGGLRIEWEAVFRYLTSRRFALNVFYACALLGGTVIIERTGETLWKMNNSGKSFEEAVDSIEKIKVQKDND